MDTFCTLVIPIIINISLIFSTLGIWKCIEPIEVTFEHELQNNRNIVPHNLTIKCVDMNHGYIPEIDKTPQNKVLWQPLSTGELFDHGRPILERSYKATRAIVIFTMCYGFFGIFMLIAPRYICTVGSNKKDTLDAIRRKIRLVELSICGAALIGTSGLLIASIIMVTKEFTASPDLCTKKHEIFGRILEKCCGDCEDYKKPFVINDKPSAWEVCSVKFLACLEGKRYHFRQFCHDISVFVVGMMCLMFSNAIFFLMTWVSVWCRNEWNYEDEDEQYTQPIVRTSLPRNQNNPEVRYPINASPVKQAVYSQVPQHVINCSAENNLSETRERIESLIEDGNIDDGTYEQPAGGTPTIARGPAYQRGIDDCDMQSNDYYCDDQISNIRAMETCLSESETKRRSKKRQFSVNESLYPKFDEGVSFSKQ